MELTINYKNRRMLSWLGLKKDKKPVTVPNLDLQRYQGTWYQQAKIPVFYQSGLTNVKTTYTLNEDGTVKVDNRGYKNGKEKGGVTRAHKEDDINSKLRVEWIPGVKFLSGGYYIVKVGDTPDYEYSVVSSPNYKNLWILSRKPKMDQGLYKEIVNWLREQGEYQVDKLQRTPM